MQKAIKAYSIGDKLYNMERIHCKIVTYTSDNYKFNSNIEKDKLINSLHNLKDLVDCMSNNFNSKHRTFYRNAINQTCSIARQVDKINDERLFNSCCYLHGAFTKFKKKLINQINRGCELKYQDVCNPLLLLELEMNENKKEKNDGM